MPKIETACICSIKIDNKEIKHTVSAVKLTQCIDDHHELQVRVKQIGKASSERDFDDPSTYTGFLGKSAAVNIASTGGVVEAGLELEFIGLVTDVKLENSIDGLNSVLIVAKSPTITLDGARRVRVFKDQSVSDVIGAIVADYPITRGKIDSTGGTMKYSVQFRETDWQYVKRLAEAAGYFAYYDGKEFSLKKANGSSDVPLAWRESLGVFSMGLGTAPSKFESKSWVYTNKKTLEGQADSSALRSTPSDIAKVSIDASKKMYDKPGYLPTAKATDQAGVDSTLGSYVESQVGQMVTCVGESIVPAVKVGHCVKINGMSQLDGLYWVIGVTHHFDESGKYYNEFTCSPLDISSPAKKTPSPTMTNLQSAVVTNLGDPDSMGRIQVKIPALGIETLWVRYASPHAGLAHGWLSMPEVGDEVLIGYENGSPDMPIAIASLYSGTDAMLANTNEKNETKMFETRSGNCIMFLDGDGKEQITIAASGAKQVITLDAEKGLISIDSDGDLNLKSKGDITIKGKNVTIESEAAIEVKAGADLNLEATANLKTKAGANLNAEASAQCVIKGAIINLN